MVQGLEDDIRQFEDGLTVMGGEDEDAAVPKIPLRLHTEEVYEKHCMPLI